jgi:IS30 family transposase
MASFADCRAWRRRKDAKSQSPGKMDNPRLKNYVRAKLDKTWSPEQIAGRISQDFPGDHRMRVSHETVYQWIKADKLQGGELYKRLRQSHRKRRRRYGSSPKTGQIPGRVDIDQRPPIVDQRGRFGDWESDTVEGKGRSAYLVTHVERKSRYLLAAKVSDKCAETVNRGTFRTFRKIPPKLRKTMTVDNGREFTKFKDLEKRLKVDVYFAHPYSSWERGLNENTNGLLREFFPKGTDFSKLTHQEVAKAVKLINNRPRKCLNFRTPYEVLSKFL